MTHSEFPEDWLERVDDPGLSDTQFPGHVVEIAGYANLPHTQSAKLDVWLPPLQPWQIDKKGSGWGFAENPGAGESRDEAWQHRGDEEGNPGAFMAFTAPNSFSLRGDGEKAPQGTQLRVSAYNQHSSFNRSVRYLLRYKFLPGVNVFPVGVYTPMEALGSETKRVILPNVINEENHRLQVYTRSVSTTPPMPNPPPTTFGPWEKRPSGVVAKLKEPERRGSPNADRKRWNIWDFEFSPSGRKEHVVCIMLYRLDSPRP